MAGAGVGNGRAETTNSRPYLWMILPVVLFLALFFGWPVLQVIALSVTEPEFGFGNYVRLFSDSAVQRMMWTTLRITVMTTIATLILGYLLAYVMAHSKGRRFVLMLACILIPLWTSVVVQSFGWLMLLKSNGIINGILQGMRLIDQPLALVRNELGVLIGMTHFMLPIAVLTLLGNMQSIDPRLVRAAKSLGASEWQAFWRVYFPESMPGIIGTAVIVMIICVGFYGIPALLGGGKTVMIAEYVTIQILQVAKWGIPAMLSTVLLFSVMLALVVVSRIIDLRRILTAG